jgi:hypothetical protein
VERLDKLHLIISYTFGSDPSTNQTDLSSEVVEHLTSHGYVVPGYKDDNQDIRLSLCKYKSQKSKERYRGSNEHVITRDAKATAEEWTYRSLAVRHPKLCHEDMPVVIVGMLI